MKKKNKQKKNGGSGIAAPIWLLRDRLGPNWLGGMAAEPGRKRRAGFVTGILGSIMIKKKDPQPKKKKKKLSAGGNPLTCPSIFTNGMRKAIYPLNEFNNGFHSSVGRAFA